MTSGYGDMGNMVYTRPQFHRVDETKALDTIGTCSSPNKYQLNNLLGNSLLGNDQCRAVDYVVNLKPSYTFGKEKKKGTKKFTDLQITYRVYKRSW